MIKLYDCGVYYRQNDLASGDNINNIIEDKGGISLKVTKEEARKNTIAYSILSEHNTSKDMNHLKLKFDSMASHDITYVGIVQTARASGLERFPLPYIMTNCHNSLCAVGGTINEDDHVFGLSAAKKYGGIFVPAHEAVIHQYMREMMAGGGKMILGSDSHTRYGALGTMAIGEGGGELAKQLLNKTYDIDMPQVVGIYLTGTPPKSVGPQDIALAIIGAVFKNGYVKNKIMEFFGDGIKNLNADYRNGIDVMTTETTCLSSIWATDGVIKQYYKDHGREDAYQELKPQNTAYYDGFIYVDMSQVRPMIAMPFHPSNVYTIDELNANLMDILDIVEKSCATQLENQNVTLDLKSKVRGNRLIVDQGVIAGCAGGTFDNICDATDILKDKSIGNDAFALSVYPSSQPTFFSLLENGVIAKLISTGATVRSAFCGPCFGAGDVPSNNAFSVRHTTRNFPAREGSKPSDGQISSVALMDARSIAATAANKGVLTSAADVDVLYSKPKYYFNSKIYENRVYMGYGKGDITTPLVLGPNIKDWPSMTPLTKDLLLKVVSVIMDPVTTTDELIPSGETSSLRSNPLGLAEHTLSRKDPSYVPKAKEVFAYEKARLEGHLSPELEDVYRLINAKHDFNPLETGIGSVIYAIKPGDGSAREQAASCQKVLGGWANIAREYATKRYRTNLINWGMLPFLLKDAPSFENGDYLFIPNIKEAIESGASEIKAYVVKNNLEAFSMTLGELSLSEREIILSGCLINYYGVSQ